MFPQWPGRWDRCCLSWHPAVCWWQQSDHFCTILRYHHLWQMWPALNQFALGWHNSIEYRILSFAWNQGSVIEWERLHSLYDEAWLFRLPRVSCQCFINTLVHPVPVWVSLFTDSKFNTWLKWCALSNKLDGTLWFLVSSNKLEN